MLHLFLLLLVFGVARGDEESDVLIQPSSWCIAQGGLDGFPLGSIIYEHTSAVECQQTCSVTDECEWFSWSASDEGCRLKTDKGELSGEDAEAVFHGPRDCGAENGDEEGKTWGRSGNAANNDWKLLDLSGLPTSQSSTAYGGEASRAVDRNTNQNYGEKSCTHTELAKNNWWRVELPQRTFVHSLVVYNRGDCCGVRLNGFSVFVDNVKCASKVNVGEGLRETVLCNRAGTVVEIRQMKKTYLSLCEVEIFGAELGEMEAVSGPEDEPADEEEEEDEELVDEEEAALQEEMQPRAWCIRPGGLEGYPLGDVIYDIASAFECMQLCSVTDKCQFFAWRSTDNGCRLKSDEGKLWGEDEDFVFHGPRDCGPPEGQPEDRKWGKCGSVANNEWKLLALNDLPVSQSSTGWGGVAGRAVDGNTNQNWGGRSCTATQIGTNNWWRVEFPKATYVHSLVVYNRADCCGERLDGFEVYVDDQACSSEDETIPQGKRGTVLCDAAGTTLEIRQPNRGILTLCEVEVFGEEVAEVSDGEAGGAEEF